MSTLPWEDSPLDVPPREPLARVYWLDRPEPTAGVQWVVVGWCGWLIGTWVIWLVTEPSQIAARWMVMTSVLGLMAVWPAARLSVRSHRPAWGRPVLRPIGRARLEAMRSRGQRKRRAAADRLGSTLVLAEWAWLTALLVMVIGMLSLQVGWSLRQTVAISVAVACWSLLTALIVGWAYPMRSAVARVTAMVLCLLLLVGEPLVVWWLAGTEAGAALVRQPWGLSPFEMIWRLSQPTGPVFGAEPWAAQGLRVGAAAAVGWVVLIVFALVRRSGRTEIQRKSGAAGETIVNSPIM